MTFGFRCSECDEIMDSHDYLVLSDDPRYDEGDVFILHTRCVKIGQTVLRQKGDLSLVRDASNGE